MPARIIQKAPRDLVNLAAATVAVGKKGTLGIVLQTKNKKYFLFAKISIDFSTNLLFRFPTNLW
ncbi:unnamed protein product [marine sediment metagenome]|uniref:Uncharacterized protein n=1 Tax=marine sediment metagenome TaxID=412755 RepID=X1KW30_9ZZZZ